MGRLCVSYRPSAHGSTYSENRCSFSLAIPVATEVPQDHPAHAISAELAGITFIKPAPSICSIQFKAIVDADRWIAEWAEALGTTMVGIAEQDDGHAELYLTESGQLIGSSQVHPACFLVGRTFQEALEGIGSGVRATPLLLPDQDHITLYGRLFRRGNEEVLGLAELGQL